MRLRFLSLFLAVSYCAFSWGTRAHRVINSVAVQTLPDGGPGFDGPGFLKNYVDWIAGRASIPDTWRRPTEPFLKIDEDPNHGWFKEQFAFMKEVPRSRYEFVLKLYDEYLRIKEKDPEQAKLMNVRWTGTLPYAAVETYERIKTGMRIYRMQKAQNQPTKLIEMDIAFYVGWLGHYIGDGAQPLHDTIHHDGWQGPNPNEYTRDPRVHGRFESAFVDLIELREEDILPRVQKPQTFTDAFGAILAHLDQAASHVEEVYTLDKSGALADKNNQAARQLVYERVSSAAQMLRDLTWMAWVESGKPIARGTMQPEQNPINPKNPNYNSATGSAPAQ